MQLGLFSRSTSAEAYHAIIEEGLLSKLRAQVYKTLYHNGPMTANELVKILNHNNKNHGVYASRLSELRRLGVVQELGTQMCSITHRNVILWDVTANLPKQKSKTISDKIIEIDLKIARLQSLKDKLQKTCFEV